MDIQTPQPQNPIQSENNFSQNSFAEKPKTNLRRLYFIIAIAVILLAGVFVWYYWLRVIPGNEELPFLNIFHHTNRTACPAMAKLCPDGSYVGPSGPNCEFVCPGEANCAKEGESIGAVVPGVVPKTCCAGLTPVVPQGIVGTMGICQKTSDQIAEWQTYTNTQYGFEVKYPKDYFFKKNNSEILIESSQSCEKILGTAGGQWPNDCFIYTLLIQENKIEASSSHLPSTNVAGYISEKFEGEGGMYDHLGQTYVQFEKSGNWYISSLSYNSENKTTAENLLNQILSTFKFTDKNSYINQPGKIISSLTSANGWALSIDLLTRNPEWTPGGGKPFFLDQNKVLNLSTNQDTKAYQCSGANPTMPVTPSDLIQIIKSPNFGSTAYFDIKGDLITAIYEQCLP